MAGATQRDRAPRDARSGPSGSGHRLRDRKRCPGRGTLARGGGEPGQCAVLGRPIEVVIRDDGPDPKAAAALYEKLITEDKADAVIGPYGSAMTDAAADVTENHRKLMVAPAAGTTSLWEKGRRYLVMVVS